MGSVAHFPGLESGREQGGAYHLRCEFPGSQPALPTELPGMVYRPTDHGRGDQGLACSSSAFLLNAQREEYLFMQKWDLSEPMDVSTYQLSRRRVEEKKPLVSSRAVSPDVIVTQVGALIKATI